MTRNISGKSFNLTMKRYIIYLSIYDIPKKCAENNILNLGIKKEETSLEDAFIKLIEDRQEYSNEEINKMQYERELEELRKEKEEKKERKEFLKERKEELKAEKKHEKEQDKEDEGGEE